MKKYLLIVILGILLLMMFGCQKGDLIREYYLSDEMIQSVPFKGSEVLKFTQGADTIVFTGVFRKRSQDEVLAGINTNDYYITESDETKFQSEAGVLKFILYSNYVGKYYISIGWNTNDENFTTSFSANLEIPLDSNNQGMGQIYINSLELNGTSFDEIYGDTTVHSTGTNEVDYILFNKTYGLLKINYKQDTGLFLNEIQWN